MQPFDDTISGSEPGEVGMTGPHAGYNPSGAGSRCVVDRVPADTNGWPIGRIHTGSLARYASEGERTG